MRLPPTVIRVCLGSDFCGLIVATIRAYVGNLFFGTLSFGMKKMVLVPSMSHMPCASLPNLLTPDLFHASLYFGCWMRSRYSRFFPVSLSKTALAIMLHNVYR